ncbi:mitochondrial [acyl-carrier protein] S-malonyltransferase Mct1 [Schizosaccharomyces osmophilus]|uniref:[acyl-carrier-protein] S-malonyltransferase n=1 Tax=Schizosaccharomyces osmophilus TaxID=2545709 RepID=A0AAF0AZ97_9SCHI|nr:mitochondrial [acyl-carrier protein] S-malonyltransferase Mct1 [Schizosaccharomyces osmophilus]WBW75033.1 mitochondrial [acyl-carrier protein] S-malonyltransferase Mct1 [Schizosaccharomyces osmophilus]
MDKMKAVLFPGQGVEWRRSMQSHLSNKIVEKTLVEAEQVTKIPLKKYILDAKVDHDLPKLSTMIVQPAILACSVGLFRAFLKRTGSSALFVGHSLGEYSALVASRALSFPSALKLVMARAKAMDEACRLTQEKTSMLALTLFNRPTYATKFQDDIIKAKEPFSFIDIANNNSSRQTVLSGKYEELAILAASIQSKTVNLGRVRVNWLDVAGAFHSRYMSPALQQLEEALLKTEFLTRDTCFRSSSGELRLPIVSNVTADLYPIEASKIREILLLQCVKPVLFWQSLSRLKSEYGITRCYPCGPGSTMQSLAKQNEMHIEEV